MGAAALPIALFAGSMVANNVQNKAANKNNDNQNAAAIGNAKQAWADARAQEASWLQSNPAPNFSFAPPPTSTVTPYQPTGANASDIFNKPPSQTPTDIMAFINQLLAHQGAQPPAPPAPAPRQTQPVARRPAPQLANIMPPPLAGVA